MVSLGRLRQRLDDDPEAVALYSLAPREAARPVPGGWRLSERILDVLQALRVDRDRSRKVAADENRREDVRLKPP